MLPDLPNISELVSGVYQDGTPVFSRTAKPRSRFVSASAPKAPGEPNHAPIESIPIPEEERAIFVSLKLLQDKVADLESQKAEAEKKFEDLQVENRTLKAEGRVRETHRRTDSALGMADSGSDDAEGGARNGNKLTATNSSKSPSYLLCYRMVLTDIPRT
jgi:hypothetical protein